MAVMNRGELADSLEQGFIRNESLKILQMRHKERWSLNKTLTCVRWSFSWRNSKERSRLGKQGFRSTELEMQSDIWPLSRKIDPTFRDQVGMRQLNAPFRLVAHAQFRVPGSSFTGVSLRKGQNYGVPCTTDQTTDHNSLQGFPSLS